MPEIKWTIRPGEPAQENVRRIQERAGGTINGIVEHALAVYATFLADGPDAAKAAASTCSGENTLQ